MTTLTEDQVHHALTVAERKRAIGDDPDHLATTLLHWHPRIELLERVAHAAELYIRFGLGETEHADLVRALDALRQTDHDVDEDEPEGFGLG